MGKCESCGAEDVPLQKVTVGGRAMDVCARCYPSTEKDKVERMPPYNCLKRKRRLL